LARHIPGKQKQNSLGVKMNSVKNGNKPTQKPKGRITVHGSRVRKPPLPQAQEGLTAQGGLCSSTKEHSWHG